MPEYWEILADTAQKVKNKCANRYCRIYCDFANQCTCNKCSKIFCIKCRLYETHHCQIEKREREERDKTSQNRIVLDDFLK